MRSSLWYSRDFLWQNLASSFFFKMVKNLCFSGFLVTKFSLRNFQISRVACSKNVKDASTSFLSNPIYNKKYWLNCLMDDGHFRITKMKKTKNLNTSS
jgi:hypothetical protein